jgi:hypothetical protein
METITACENVCRDFTWVGPVTEWLRNLAIILGVFVGWRQLEAWRSEARSRRGAEIAEKVISLVYEISDAIRGVRSPMENVPVDSENRRDFIIEQKSTRLNETKDDFDELRRMQVLSKAILDISDVDDGIATIFEIRQELFAIFHTLHGVRDEHFYGDQNRDFYHELEMKMYSIGGERDEIHVSLKSAVDKIENLFCQSFVLNLNDSREELVERTSPLGLLRCEGN